MDPIILSYLATILGALGVREIGVQIASMMRERSNKSADSKSEQVKNDLTREERMEKRIADLEAQIKMFSTQLITSESIRARQGEKIEELEVERNMYRTWYYDLATIVQREESSTADRIFARYSVVQIQRSAPKGESESNITVTNSTIVSTEKREG